MKKDRKILRQCGVCREYKQKDELIRLTKDYETEKINVNRDNSVNGRSLYICKNEECISKFLKNKKSLNSLNSKMNDDIKNEIIKELFFYKTK